ncbi:hypothetical protein [Allochromatium palmeri]|uniref:Uncharacterized protein n=1 Tax=Allochromatium palmeri TaxID=231048 RepID=A0A6N8EHZ1_9GAMM|nr:hypothetical protein [Allochromatium palmeri]MTW23250.1 hypothetical protein [Allochromatium palmeri]
MDYFQGVVADYLRAHRSTFINSEFLLQLDEGKVLGKGRYWYCDIVAVDFSQRGIFLCEVTYSKTVHALIKRLSFWNQHWVALCNGIYRETGIPKDWSVKPWLFIPEERRGILDDKLANIVGIGSEGCQIPRPDITYLEEVMPWKYDNHDREPSRNE